MKIMLFSTPIMDFEQGELKTIAYDYSKECPPYGLYLLSTILSNEGHEVVLVDLILEGTNRIKKFIPDLFDSSIVGISATSLSWPTAIDIISQVKKIKPDLQIVLGGVHPSTFPEYIISNFNVEYIIRGEAEISFPLLCKTIESCSSLHQVPGLTWKSNGKIHSNPCHPRLTKSQLIKFPFPNFNSIKKGFYKGLSIESSRGCKFNCCFCGATYRRDWISLPPSRFLDNLEKLISIADKTLLKIQYIIDDEFSTDPKRCIEIANGIRKRGLKPRLTYDCRVPDILAEGFLENMADFTKQILIGAECGYDKGLKRIGKGITTSEIESAAKALYKNDMASKTDFSFIIGLPWENVNNVQDTIRFAGYLFSEYGVRILIQWYVQMPGSRLWNDFRKKQVIHEKMYDNYGFFRNLYLFRSGNILTPSEIWDLARAIEAAKVISRIRYPQKQMIEHSLPQAIYENFPEQGL